MPDDILEEYIVQHIDASRTPEIRFSWHGGEPTVLGLDYFRKIAALQRKHRPPGTSITNGIQTNGTLLDEEWCRFLAAERFSVGISLDGPKEMHDRYRVDKGRETHARAGDARVQALAAARSPLRYTLRGARPQCPASHRGVPVLQGDRGRLYWVSAPGRARRRTAA